MRPADIASALRQPRTLSERGHRPWPLPDRPWVMGQTWEDLMFAHWRVDAAAVRRVVPPQLALDAFDGCTWVGVTPFVVSGMRLRLTPPLPGAARFPEINVRTYVTVDGKPGIYFFSLDTSHPLAVQAARRVYRLPYFRARMSVERDGDRIRYRSERTSRDGPSADVEAFYGPTGPAQRALPGTFEHWATERYCLYTLDERQRVLRADIHHPPWPLRPAEARFSQNTMGRQVGIELDGEPVLLFAERQDVVFWLPRSA